jgi:phospholipid/cholesterol/gamma-HCH transport system substrate-binding protein
MLTRVVRIQVVAFVVIALAAVAFVGANYAGLDRLLGGWFGADSYTVALQLDDGGGIFTNSEVTYRGVAVGRVGELRLTDDGMEADLVISDDAPPIPADARAVVANRSAIGEQYVDLQPSSTAGPFLADGGVIPRSAAAVPPPVTDLLGDLSAFNRSVPTGSLRTVVDELYAATNDTGPDLQVLLDSSISFTDTAAEHLPQTSTLIDDGAVVLRTQLDSSAAWRSFSRNAKLFATELADSDGDLRALIGAAPAAATQLSRLLSDTNPSLSVLLANLLTTAEVFDARTDGLEQLFVMTPRAVAATSTAITPDGSHLSVVLRFFEPRPCVRGYESTVYRKGEDVRPGLLDARARCTLPKGDPRLVRGSQHAPTGGVPDPAIPGGGARLPGPLGAPDLAPVAENVEELLWPRK